MAYFGLYFGGYHGHYFGIPDGPGEPSEPQAPLTAPALRASLARRRKAPRPVPPKTRRLGDSPTDHSVREVKAAVQTVLDSPIPFGVPVEVEFTAPDTPVTVPHGLNKAPLGYTLVRASASVSVYDSGSTDKSITLLASAPCKATLWIF